MSKRILITGATDGIGEAFAKYMASKGHHVIIHGRNREKVKDTALEIIKKTKNKKIDTIVADFASLTEVQSMSKSLLGKYNFLDILINNAAVIAPEYIESVDKIELTFQVNYLSPFLLTLNVLPLLKSKQSSQIINIASIAHAETINFNTILDPEFFDSYSAYEISKLCNILFTYKLAKKLQNKKITVNCLHPGVISTKLLHVLWSGGAPVKNAVEVIKNVMIQAEKKFETGKFFAGKSLVLSSAISYDENTQQKIWDFSMNLLKLKGIIPGNF